MSAPERIEDGVTDPGPIGSSFDDFLAEHGILEECTTHAVKAVFAWQLDETRRKAGKSKSEFARMLGTSRSQLDRLLDPDNDAVTLETLQKAAALLGKHVRLELIDAEPIEAAVAEAGVSGVRL
jgi:DNA-binding Xre family transcriptional regulator